MEPGVEPTSYQLRQDVGQTLIRKRLLRRLLPIAVIAPVVAVATPFFSRPPDAGPPSIVPTLIALAMVAIIGFIVYRRALARELEMWGSYRLALTSNIARRVIAGVAPAEVLRSEVTRIIAVPEQGLYVHTADPLRFVFIPEQLDRFEEVRAALGQWALIQPPDQAKARLNQGLGALLGLAILGAWFASSWVSDPRALVASLCVLYGGIAYLGWSIVRNPNLTMRQKASILLVCGLMALGPLARLALVQGRNAP